MKIINKNLRSISIAVLLGLHLSAGAEDAQLELRGDSGSTRGSDPASAPSAAPAKEGSDRKPIAEIEQKAGSEVESEAIVEKGDAAANPSAPIREADPESVSEEILRARTIQPKVAAPAPAAGKRGNVSWTERYELGPGDYLNFALHGQPKLAKRKVPVAPDWTISYLQAQQVSVRGLTVVELDLKMEEILGAYHRNPKLIVTPAELGSKKYAVLGKVKNNDIYKLDRPTSLLEAIAKAKGIVVGVRNSNATELADLGRSFVVRAGEKLDVDIERLYRSGDMTQNVQIEPGDYIYIASNVHNESYVFGSVARPGIVALAGKMTVMGAIAESGSYSKYAWKKRVLLIRGSVGNPVAEVINTRDVLRGKEKDVLLEPGDIVYVHKRPWSYAEEILDIAIKSYIQAAVTYSVDGTGTVSIGL